ncbi:MAG: type II secretion system major pseudopilin GspG [bacterium]|nr:type II secretion system major pseudopilin GspG [bacterium]MDD5354389.1 type II secretion system major pseudopilin GspG [bacterium]MDD5755858.1 type II secretion system major pseudopilin GspG [bacterium]
MKLNNKQGFTLIEIMLVVVIISILVTVVLPRFTGKTEQARNSAARLQIETIGMALDSYELDNGRYPTNAEGLQGLRSNPGNLKKWTGPYLKKDVPQDPWGNNYVYVCPGTHNTDYDLYSYGPNGAEGGGDDIGNWTEKPK